MAQQPLLWGKEGGGGVSCRGVEGGEGDGGLSGRLGIQCTKEKSKCPVYACGGRREGGKEELVRRGGKGKREREVRSDT